MLNRIDRISLNANSYIDAHAGMSADSGVRLRTVKIRLREFQARRGARTVDEQAPRPPRDLALRRSFRVLRPTAALAIRAGFLVALVPLDVRVLTSFGHAKGTRHALPTGRLQGRFTTSGLLLLSGQNRFAHRLATTRCPWFPPRSGTRLARGALSGGLFVPSQVPGQAARAVACLTSGVVSTVVCSVRGWSWRKLLGTRQISRWLVRVTGADAAGVEGVAPLPPGVRRPACG
jgi:hypothetical protein